MGAFLKRMKKRRQLRNKRKSEKEDARDVVERAKIAKKTAEQLKKVYGNMSPEEVQAINSVQPLMPKMVEELQNAEVPITNPNDPVEVTARYANYNPQIPDVVPQEEIEAAYGENPEGFENFDKKNALKIVGSALVGAVGGVLDYSNKLKQKPMAERTPSEQRFIDTSDSVKKTAINSGVKMGVNSVMQDYGLLIVLALVLYIWYKS